MKNSLKSLVSRFHNGQKGFTLIEMIVVVGIIAVLAAVIVPNMGKFIGQGEAGAMNAENDALQTAMNAMMADQSISTVTALANPSNSSQTWTALPAGTGAAPWMAISRRSTPPTSTAGMATATSLSRIK